MSVAVVDIARTRPADPEQYLPAAHRILADLVAGGAALGWVEPPSLAEVTALFDDVTAAAEAGDGSLRAAYLDNRLIGIGYWTRYPRPTHRRNADVQKIAVAADAQGRGVGRAITTALINDARQAGIEVLTLDVRGDNTTAQHLYESLGFTAYGRLPDFVAVGDNRYDKVCYYLDLRRPAPR